MIFFFVVCLILTVFLYQRATWIFLAFSENCNPSIDGRSRTMQTYCEVIIITKIGHVNVQNCLLNIFPILTNQLAVLLTEC